MTLHRDIFWIGRQWAVTGHGIQAVDRRRHGAFDVEVPRIWGGAAFEGLREQPWFNAADFEKALAMARTRFPVPSVAVALSPPLPTPPGFGPEVTPLALMLNAPLSICVRNARAKFLPQWRLRQ